MLLIKSKHAEKGKPAFTFELDENDLAQLAENILRGDWRASIRQTGTRTFLGSLEFRTLRFRPYAGRKEMLDALESGESLSVFLVPRGAVMSNTYREQTEVDA